MCCKPALVCRTQAGGNRKQVALLLAAGDRRQLRGGREMTKHVFLILHRMINILRLYSMLFSRKCKHLIAHNLLSLVV